MKRTTPPFRADHVGSYLRSAAITEARAKREKGEISAADLKKVEDQEIPKVIKKQEDVGLKCTTDGEYRRMFWHFDFYDGLDNVEIYELDHGIQFQGVQTKPKSIRVTGKIDFSNHPMLEHFKFVKAAHQGDAEDVHPVADRDAFPVEPGAVDKKTYPNRDAIFSDLSAAYRKAVKAFYDAGCRYLQFDDTAWAYLCSDVEMKKAKDRGMNAATLPTTTPASSTTRSRTSPPTWSSPRTSAAAISARPGSRRAATSRSPSGMLGQCNFDGYFLEYDSDRAGGFEPLRFLPKGKKIVVVGVITSKSGTLESKDTVKRRIDEAAKFAPLEQLALSPQCGFASTEEGNVLTEEQQWAKMREVVEIAEEVWGSRHRRRQCARKPTAPFRADHVGSLLRPAALKEARAKHAKGEIDAAAASRGRGSRDREDHQEAGGDRAEARDRRRVAALLVAIRFLQGPRRRRNLLDRQGHHVRRRRDQGRERAHVGKLGFSGHPHIDDFKFVKATPRSCRR